jgi:hypothetical protein
MLESNTKIVYTKYPFTSPMCAATACVCVCELLPVEASAAIVLVALHLGYFYM